MVELLRSPALSALTGVAHGFTGRRGGVSEGPLASLNLARRPGERDAALVANWSAAMSAAGLSGPIALMNQVHGAEVLEVLEGSGPLAVAGDADALLTRAPGVALAVRVADCVPVLLAAPSGAPRGAAIAAVHAGWRGTAARIVEAAVDAVCEASGARPETLVAAIGPAIGPCCYEVSQEVADAICAAGGRALPGPRGRPHLDLREANAAQLRGRGVTTIDFVGPCTRCSPDHYSHRGDGPATGRQVGLIALR